MTWTSEIVIYRLIRAADTIRRLPGGGLRPAGFTSAWPAVRDEWADQLARVGSEETRGRDRPRLSPPRPGEIDRMYQCMDWMVHVGDLEHRKALMIYCRDKAHGWRFSRTCKKLGWNRRTAYNRKDKAALEVASALNNKAVSLPQADIDAVTQTAAELVCISDTMKIHVHLWFVRLETSFSYPTHASWLTPTAPPGRTLYRSNSFSA